MLVLWPINLVLGIPLLTTAGSIGDLASHPWKLILRSVVSVPVTLAYVMISITMLSVAYREIIGLPVDAGAPEASGPA